MSPSFYSMTFGELLTLVAMIGTAIAFVFGVGRKQQGIDSRIEQTRLTVEEMRTDLKDLSGVVTQIAVQDARMDNFDRRLDDVVHGRIRVSPRASG